MYNIYYANVIVIILIRIRRQLNTVSIPLHSGVKYHQKVLASIRSYIQDDVVKLYIYHY